MRNFVVSIVLVVLCGYASVCNGADQQNMSRGEEREGNHQEGQRSLVSSCYFPLVKGAEYIYQGRFGKEVYSLQLVMQTSNIDGVLVYYYIEKQNLKGKKNPIISSHVPGFGVFVQDDDSLSTLDCDWKEDLQRIGIWQKQIMLKFPMSEGATTRIMGLMGEEETFTVKAFETVQVPAGIFENCARIQIETKFPSGTQEKSSFWLAKGVGVVKWCRSTGRTDELEKYILPLKGGRDINSNLRVLPIQKREERDWEWISKYNCRWVQEAFLKEYPASKYSTQLKQKMGLSDLIWTTLNSRKIGSISIETKQGPRPLNVSPFTDTSTFRPKIIETLKSLGVWTDQPGGLTLNIKARIDYVALRAGTFTSSRGSFTLPPGYSIQMTYPPSFSSSVSYPDEGHASMPFGAVVLLDLEITDGTVMYDLNDCVHEAVKRLMKSVEDNASVGKIIQIETRY